MNLKDKPTILIDGDILAYRAAAATDGRQYILSYSLDDQKITTYFKYKKEAVTLQKSLEEEGEAKDITLDLEHDPDPFEDALKVLKDMMKNLECNLETHIGTLGNIKVYLSIGGSFRSSVCDIYKENRKDVRKPEHLKALKDYMLSEGAECREGELEADDLLAINQEAGSSVICSIDKDLLQVPGYHYNFIKDELVYVSKLEGCKNLFSQALTGDTADGITGLKGVGPVTAKKTLAACCSASEMYSEVLQLYQKKWPKKEGASKDEHKSECAKALSINMQLLYLLRSEGDQWLKHEVKLI